MELTASGKSSPPPTLLKPRTLNCLAVSTSGGEPSSDSVLPSLPLVCSKKTPYPPRIAILPLPLGSKAKPNRGAGLKRCPLRQPAFEEDPMLAVGKSDPDTRGKVPPGPPHWTTPLSALMVPPAFCANEPSELKSAGVGALALLKAFGSRLKACL